MQRGLIPITTHNTGFIQYMDSGIWHLAIYNDGKETETVSFLTTATGERLRRRSLSKPRFALRIIWKTQLQPCSGSQSFARFFFSFLSLQRKVQVNQGEDEYDQNPNVGMIPSCLCVELWKIIISSLPWVSSEWITGPASGNHLHTIQYDCTILWVPFLIVICSNLHLLSIYQKREVFFSPNSTPVCHTTVASLVEDFVLYASLFCSPLSTFH